MTSFLGELRLGRFRWDLIYPFPQQPSADQALGDRAVADLRATIDDLDAAHTNGSPDWSAPGVIKALSAAGLLSLTVPATDGGRGLSGFNTFRILEEASRRSGALGLMLSVHNALGVPAYLPALAPGALRDYVTSALAAGTLCGVADTEPDGAANRERRTRAVACPGGYLLSGEKTFIGNGLTAGLLAVSATVDDTGRIDLFLVDTASAGFSVIARHDFMGLEGAASAALRLDRVFVPHGNVLVAFDGGWRSSALVARINALARLYITVAPAAAAARDCLAWSREFLRRRQVDGRPLADYDAVAHRLSASLAEVFALDSVVRWCLLGADADQRGPERTSAKNIGTMLAWRIVDRTMSLCGAEGFETAASKARRGVPPLPIEQAMRDARGLRIAGGVDFNIDFRAAQSGILPSYYAGTVCDADLARAVADPIDLRGAPLSAANRRNLETVRARIAALGVRCLRLTRAHPEPDLQDRQCVLIAVNRIADELFTVSVVLAAAASHRGPDPDLAQELAQTYCDSALARVETWQQQVDAPEQMRPERLSSAWMAGGLAATMAGR